MSIRTRILLMILLIFVLIIIIDMVRKRSLELKYVLGWLACDIALIIFACFPQLMNGLAALMGIYSPMNMIFFIGFVLAMGIIFSLTVSLSRLSAKVRKISQIVAMLPDEIREELLRDEDADTK